MKKVVVFISVLITLFTLAKTNVQAQAVNYCEKSDFNDAFNYDDPEFISAISAQYGDMENTTACLDNIGGERFATYQEAIKYVFELEVDNIDGNEVDYYSVFFPEYELSPPSTCNIFFRMHEFTKNKLSATSNCTVADLNVSNGGADQDNGKIAYVESIKGKITALIKDRGFPINGKDFLLPVQFEGEDDEINLAQTPTPMPTRSVQTEGDVQDLQDLLENSCGGHGEVCCDVDKIKSSSQVISSSTFGANPQDDPTDSGRGLNNLTRAVRRFINNSFSKKIVSTITNTTTDQLSAVSGGQNICNYSNAVILTKIGGESVSAENYFSDNQYKSISVSTSGEASYQYIPKNQVESCTCIDPNITDEDPRNTEEISNKASFGFTEEKIIGDICGDNDSDCTSCLSGNENNIYQNFASDNKCIDISTDEDLAESRLNAYIESNTISQTNADTKKTIANSKSFTGGSSVLAAFSVPVACSRIVDVNNKKDVRFCSMCIYSAGFFTYAGCSPRSLSVNNFKKLCKNIATDTTEGQKESQSCNDCVFKGGTWTAIGCVYPDLKLIIEHQILGTGLGIAGTFTLGCIIYAAILMQISAGDAEKTKKAQELLTSCITGLIIIIFAIFILRIIGVDILRIPGMG